MSEEKRLCCFQILKQNNKWKSIRILLTKSEYDWVLKFFIRHRREIRFNMRDLQWYFEVSEEKFEEILDQMVEGYHYITVEEL